MATTSSRKGRGIQLDMAVPDVLQALSQRNFLGPPRRVHGFCPRNHDFAIAIRTFSPFDGSFASCDLLKNRNELLQIDALVRRKAVDFMFPRREIHGSCHTCFETVRDIIDVQEIELLLARRKRKLFAIGAEGLHQTRDQLGSRIARSVRIE